MSSSVVSTLIEPPAAALPPLSNREVRELKSRSQRLTAVTKLGKSGLSPDFVAGVDRELAQHELIKVKLTELKDQRFELGKNLAALTRSHLVWVIGHVLVLYRQKSAGDPLSAPIPAAPPTPTAAPLPASARGGPPKNKPPTEPARPVTWKAIGVIAEPTPAPRPGARRRPPTTG